MILHVIRMFNKLSVVSVLLLLVYLEQILCAGFDPSSNDGITSIGGMNTLGVVSRHTALALFFLAIQHAAAVPPYGGFRRLKPYRTRSFSYLPIYRPQQMYNPFQGRLFPVPFMRPLAQQPIPFIRRPMQTAPMPQMLSPWAYHVSPPKLPPKVVYRQAKPKKRISVLSGPLVNVVPYPHKPTSHGFKSKKAQRRKMVAKAKSFPGILKNTALGTNML